MMRIDRHFKLIAIVVVLVATAAGMWLGNLSVPKHQSPNKLTDDVEIDSTEQEDQAVHDTQVHVSVGAGAHLPSVLKELQFAIESGVYSFLVSTSLPQNEEEQLQLSQIITRILNLDSEVRIELAINCNPPIGWLREHPDDTSTSHQEGLSYPSIGSEAWMNWAQENLAEMTNSIQEFTDAGLVQGVVLEGMENGHWLSDNMAYDQSPIHQQAFQEWLSNKYESIEALQQAWNDKEFTNWESIITPSKVVVDAVTPMFYSPPTQLRLIDYHQFLNEVTASTINTLSQTVKKGASEIFRVSIPYGNVFEYPHAASGNWGEANLDYTVIDGLVTFPQSQEKGMGRHAFFAAPPYINNSWVSLDSIYTGIQYDKSSDSIQVPGTYYPTQIDKLMARNGAIASLYNVTWAWSDTQGQGTLAHPPLWSHLQKHLALRTTLNAQNGENSPNVMVVMDEASMRYVQDDDFIKTIFSSMQDAVIRSGVEVAWTTLASFLNEESTTKAPVYIFPNIFHILPAQREVLHKKLAAQEATAIWLYAPGYIGEEANVSHVSALTGVSTSLRKDELKSGSKFAFTGTWIEQDQAFGDERNIPLLFKSVDDLADPLARYQDNDDISVAMKYLEAGWTSIVHYEPALTPEFLHTLMSILEIPLHLTEITIQSPIICYTNSNFTLMHADKDVGVQMYFERAQDISNLLNTQQGWNNTRFVDLNLGAGDSVVLDYQSK